MKRVMRTVLGVAVAVALLTASDASATHLSITVRPIRVTWAAMKFKAPGFREVSCPTTLEGSFHSVTIPKVRRVELGQITRATIHRPCSEGTMWAYNGREVNETLLGGFPDSLPWEITYEAFRGRLPAITGVHVLIPGMRIMVRLIEEGGMGTNLCSYLSENVVTRAIGGIIELDATGRTERFTIDTEEQFIESDIGFLCGTGFFTAAGRFYQLGTTTEPRITLIR